MPLNKTKLIKVIKTDKRGRKITRWVRPDQKSPKQKSKKSFEEVVSKIKKTSSFYKDENGNYKEKRAELHNKIVSSLLKGATKSEKPTLILMGGGTASGKSTLRNAIVNPNLESVGIKTATIDSDDIKGHLPEYSIMQKQDVKTAAMKVHEESGEILDYAVEEALNGGLDTLIDGTMRNAENVIPFIKKAKELGYQVNVVLADVPLEEAKKRAKTRAEKTGRTVPEFIIEDSHQGVPNALMQYKDLVDNWVMYDTSGDTPERIASNQGIANKERWNQFVEKGKMKKNKINKAYEGLGLVAFPGVTVGKPQFIDEKQFNKEDKYVEGRIDVATESLQPQIVIDNNGIGRKVWVKTNKKNLRPNIKGLGSKMIDNIYQAGYFINLGEYDGTFDLISTKTMEAVHENMTVQDIKDILALRISKNSKNGQ